MGLIRWVADGVRLWKIKSQVKRQLKSIGFPATKVKIRFLTPEESAQSQGPTLTIETLNKQGELLSSEVVDLNKVQGEKSCQ
jgi:hypothetical protein